MSSNEKDNLPPSYSESLRQPLSPTPTSSQDRGQNILDRLTLTRAQAIRSVIDDQILPVIEDQAAYGISRTTLALLPSDIPLPPPEEKSEFSFSTSSSTPQVSVISFSGDEEPKVVRLLGQVNKTEFWRLPAVLEELERVLRSSLDRNERVVKPPEPIVSPTQQAKQAKRGFFERVAGAMGQEDRRGAGSHALNMEQPDDAGRVRVKVRLEEICLRTVNEFGLYDTLSRQCVVVLVDAGC